MARRDVLVIAGLVMSAAGLVSAAAHAQRGAARRPAQARQADAPPPRQGDLRPDDSAPDFSLAPLGAGADVTLSSFRGKPVALVFGSYT